MKVPIYVLKEKEYEPLVNINLSPNSTIGYIKETIGKAYDDKYLILDFFINPDESFNLFQDNNYNNYELTSLWKKLNNPFIVVIEKENTFLEKLPQDIFELMITQGEIKGKSLINLCSSSKKLKEKCKKNDYRIFRKLLGEYGNFYKYPRENYIRMNTPRYYVFSKHLSPTKGWLKGQNYKIAKPNMLVQEYHGGFYYIKNITKSNKMSIVPLNINNETIKEEKEEFKELMIFPTVDGEGLRYIEPDERLIEDDHTTYYGGWGKYRVDKTILKETIGKPRDVKAITVNEEGINQKQNIMGLIYIDEDYRNPTYENFRETSKNVLVESYEGK